MTLTKDQKLRNELKSLSDELLKLKKHAAKLSAQILNKEEALKKAKKELEKLDRTPPKISEHAILRYLERVTGIDMEMIKAAILPKEMEKLVAEGGEGKYNMGTHTITVAGNTIVSVH